MARLIYTAIASLDGYIEDVHGKFDWAAPDQEVHRYINDLERPVGTYLYGRRLYETMVYWETALSNNDHTDASADYAALWQAADKIVFSRTLQTVTSERTRLEPHFEPEAIRRLKGESTSDLSVGGSNLAAQAFRADLVDECHLFLVPVMVGGGKSALPGGVHLTLDLLDERRFRSGVVHLHYRVTA